MRATASQSPSTNQGMNFKKYMDLFLFKTYLWGFLDGYFLGSFSLHQGFLTIMLKYLSVILIYNWFLLKTLFCKFLYEEDGDGRGAGG